MRTTKEHYTSVVNDALEKEKVILQLGGYTAFCLEDSLKAFESLMEMDYSSMARTIAGMIAEEDRKSERLYLSEMFALISVLSRYGEDIRRARIILNNEIIKQLEDGE